MNSSAGNIDEDDGDKNNNNLIIIYLHTTKTQAVSAHIRTYWGTGGECCAAEDGVVHRPHRKCVLMSLPPESVCLHFAGNRENII